MNCVVAAASRNFSAAASRCAHMMARGLAANGCSVDFIVGGRGDYPGKDHEGCTDYRFHCLATTEKQRGSPFAHFRMLYCGIIQKRWDVMVFYSVGVQFIPLISLARRHGLKIVYVQGDHYVPLQGMTVHYRAKLAVVNAIDCYLALRADLNVLTGTSLLGDHFRKQAPNVPFYLSYPPIDTDLFAEGDGAGFRSRYGLGDQKIIAYCGSIGSLEGVEVLIRAMRRVAQTHPHAHLVIAGKLGVYDHALSRQIDYPVLAAELGIADRVTFTGFIDEDGVRGLLQAAYLLVMPKLDHRRNAVAAPIKLSEYLAAGKPVVASTVGDVATRFNDGVELLFCDPGNFNDLAVKLSQLLDAPELALKIADEGHAYACKHFDYRSWGRDVLTLLERERK